MEKVLYGLQQLIKNAIEAQSEDGTLKVIRKVYYGDPIKIAQDDTPCVCIQPISTEYIRRGSRTDHKKYIIELRVVFNQKAYYDLEGWSEKVNIVEGMMHILEGVKEWSIQDVDTQSLAGLVQSNCHLQYIEWGVQYTPAQDCKVLSVDYRFNKARWYPTYEGVIRLQAEAIGDRK